MASQAQVLHEKESRVKTALAKVQSTVQRVFQSVIMGYEGSQISLEFDIISCDQNLMQALINAAAVNLAQSGFRCKCIPAAITVALTDKMAVDPASADAINATSILFAVVDSDKEEFLFSELVNSSHAGI